MIRQITAFEECDDKNAMTTMFIPSTTAPNTAPPSRLGGDNTTRLGPGELLTASRVKLDLNELQGAGNGRLLNLQRPSTLPKIPKTGISPVDQISNQFNTVFSNAPQTISQKTNSALMGGLSGSIVGFIIGVFSQGMSIVSDLANRRVPGGAAFTLLLTGLGTLIGGGIGALKPAPATGPKIQFDGLDAKDEALSAVPSLGE